MGDGPRNSRLGQYQRDRRNFALIVYTLCTAFVLISLAQWMLVILIDDLSDFVRDNYFVSIIGFVVVLLVVSIFVFYENVRFSFPINWILTIIIIEGVTLGMARPVVDIIIDLFGISFVAVVVVMLVLILIGIIMPHDLTLDVVVLFVLAILFFLGSVFFMLLYLMAVLEFSLYVYAGFVIVTIITFVMYHAQTINGGRYAEIRLSDYLLAALIVYHDFMILFMLSLFLAKKIDDETNGSDETTTTERLETTTEFSDYY